MKFSFIICEYNPLHNGHIYQLNKTKEITGCDKVVCLMSGNITQRGDISCADKYTRATWAVECGADIVVEIPPQFCLGSAQIYAQGAISLASYFEGEKALCFGSECGDIDLLKKVAYSCQSPQLQKTIQNNLQSGKNYAHSLSDAMSQHQGQLYQNILQNPNNTLGIEYLLAIQRNNIDITPYTIQRKDSGYNSLQLDDNIASATAIRYALQNHQSISNFVPQAVNAQLKYFPNTQDKLFSIAKYCLKEQDLSKIFGIKEGLHNRIISSLQKSQNMQEFYQIVSTKRYTLATIKRCLLACILDYKANVKTQKTAQPFYANVLAIKKENTNLLSLINLPTITKPSDWNRFNLNDPILNKSDRLFESTTYNFEKYLEY